MQQDTLNKCFFEILSFLFEGVQVFESDQASMVESPFITYKILSGPRRFGSDSESIQDIEESDDLLVTYSGQREFTLSVNFIGPGSQQRAYDLIDALDMYSLRSKIAEIGKENDLQIVVYDSSAIQNLNTLLSSEYEERCQLDLFIRVASIRSENIATIGTIKGLESEFRNEAGNIIYEDENDITL